MQYTLHTVDARPHVAIIIHIDTQTRSTLSVSLQAVVQCNSGAIIEIRIRGSNI